MVIFKQESVTNHNFQMIHWYAPASHMKVVTATVVAWFVAITAWPTMAQAACPSGEIEGCGQGYKIFTGSYCISYTLAGTPGAVGTPSPVATPTWSGPFPPTPTPLADSQIVGTQVDIRFDTFNITDFDAGSPSKDYFAIRHILEGGGQNVAGFYPDGPSTLRPGNNHATWVHPFVFIYGLGWRTSGPSASVVDGKKWRTLSFRVSPASACQIYSNCSYQSVAWQRTFGVRGGDPSIDGGLSYDQPIQNYRPIAAAYHGMETVHETSGNQIHLHTTSHKFYYFSRGGVGCSSNSLEHCDLIYSCNASGFWNSSPDNIISWGGISGVEEDEQEENEYGGFDVFDPGNILSKGHDNDPSGLEFDICKGAVKDTPCFPSFPENCPVSWEDSVDGDTAVIVMNGKKYWCAWAGAATWYRAPYIDWATVLAKGYNVSPVGLMCRGSTCGGYCVVENCGDKSLEYVSARHEILGEEDPEVERDGWQRPTVADPRGVIEILGDQNYKGIPIPYRKWGETNTTKTAPTEFVQYYVERTFAFTVKPQTILGPDEEMVVTAPGQPYQEQVWIRYERIPVDQCPFSCQLGGVHCALSRPILPNSIRLSRYCENDPVNFITPTPSPQPSATP